jgi:bacillithiol system protein YtxJ
MTEITTPEDWNRLIAESHDHALFVFKHSTTCPISFAAHHRVTAHWNGRTGLPPIYLVKVIESRPLSNAIAAETGVTHQSPQLLLVREGKAAWNASHGNITADAIDGTLQHLP